MNSRNGQDGSQMFYLKAWSIFTGGSTANKNKNIVKVIANQEANINIPTKDKVQGD